MIRDLRSAPFCDARWTLPGRTNAFAPAQPIMRRGGDHRIIHCPRRRTAFVMAHELAHFSIATPDFAHSATTRAISAGQFRVFFGGRADNGPVNRCCHSGPLLAPLAAT